MSKSQQIAHSSLALLASNAANKVIGFLVMLSVARFLGAEQFGLYTFVFSYVWLFSLLTDLGLTPIVAREIVRDDGADGSCLGGAVATRAAASVAAYLFCVSGSLLANGWNPGTRLIAVSALTFFYAPWSTANAVFTAKLKLYGPSIVNLVSRLLLWVAVQLLARAQAPLMLLILVEVGLGAITTAVLWFWACRLLKPLYRIDRTVAFRQLMDGIPLLLTSLFIALYFRLDVFFLEYFKGSAAVGEYAAAYRLTEAIPLAAAAFTSSLFPLICRACQEGNSRELARWTGLAQRVLAAMAAPAILLLVWFARPVVHLLYSGRFDASAPALAILSSGQIFLYANILSTTLMTADNQGRRLMWVTMSMVPWNLVLNLLVIPRYGVPGAAATTVTTEFAGMLCLLILTRTLGGWMRAALRVLSAALPGMLFLWAAELLSPGGMLWQVPVFMLLYALSVRLLGVFNRDEWDRMRQVLP